MHELGKLFGSPARVKLLRLFVFNTEAVFDRDDAARRARISPLMASKELAHLARAGIVKRRIFFRDVVRPVQGQSKKRKVVGWTLEKNYPYVAPLTRFLADTVAVSHEEVRKRLKPAGNIRLLVLTGVFTDTRESVLDLLIVGDRLNERELTAAMHSLEADIGRELRYAQLTTEEYLFRRRVRDRLVRDVMDYPHEALIDRIVAL